MGPLIRAIYTIKKNNRPQAGIRVIYVPGSLPYEVFGTGAWVEVLVSPKARFALIDAITVFTEC